jgi:peptidoglycan/LPS O-acetylase OafA/YrhL
VAPSDRGAVTADVSQTGSVRSGRAARLTFPDALRGLAALWVVLFHFGEGRHIAHVQAMLPDVLNHAVFRAGHFGVPVFFVLSGFVIALSIGSDAVDARYVGRFALRRAIRLDIPYWASIAISIVVFAVKRELVPNAQIPTITISSLAAHLFYLQEFLGFREINPVFWTLTYEVQFYLAFCILLALAHAVPAPEGDTRPRNAVVTIAAVLSIAAPVVPALQFRGSALGHWHGFLLGAFIAWALTSAIRTRWVIVYAIALLGMWTVSRDSFTIVCVITGGVLLLVGRAGHLGDWWNAAPLQLLGRVSYSLYLLHVPVSGMAFYAFFRVWPKSPATELAAFAVVLAVNILAAWGFWWAVERPSTALARRLRKG